MARHYTNLDGTTPDKRLGAILKWQIADRLTGKKRKDPGGFTTPRRPNDGRALLSPAPSLTWIGHASFVQRLGGVLLATDPIWSERLGPRRRLVGPGVTFADVPQLDVVTISHSHYDHLDLPTLRRFGDGPTYVVPRDVGEILRDEGLTKVVELGWWESHTVRGLRMTLVPAQHWSMRTPWDRNQRLWGGFVYESAEGASYHAGDTAYHEAVFHGIRARFPRIDWAMLPIGAYDPPWFMKAQHMGPEEAVQAFEDLGARTFVAMHWGTFKLTDEPLGEPPARLRACWASRELAADRLWIPDVGETRALELATSEGVTAPPSSP
jgi:L-ascorbate metabolism protein UlaG (beta-lactamase superfamily)